MSLVEATDIQNMTREALAVSSERRDEEYFYDAEDRFIHTDGMSYVYGVFCVCNHMIFSQMTGNQTTSGRFSFFRGNRRKRKTLQQSIFSL